MQSRLADVVVPALRDGEGGRAAEQWREGGDDARQVAADQLPLQGESGGGHHHRLATFEGAQDGRHEVGHRLAGARARLHEQVLTGGHGSGNGMGHAALPLTSLTTDSGHDGVQGVVEAGHAPTSTR